MDAILYGKKDGKDIYIEDAKRGKACGCVCPACKAALVAKKGSKMMHHFSHLSGSNCEYGYETTLHLLAKDILSKCKQIKLPEKVIESTQTKYNYLVKESELVNISKVEIEKWDNYIKPDLIIYTDTGYKFNVEIFVTHKIDDDKLNKIKQLNIDTIEIELNKVYTNNTEEDIKKILMEDNDNKYWVYSKEVEDKLNIIKKENIVNTKYYNSILYTQHCPQMSYPWHKDLYASVRGECLECMYFCDINENEEVICYKINNFNEDNIKYNSKHKKKKKNEYSNYEGYRHKPATGCYSEITYMNVQIEQCSECNIDLIVEKSNNYDIVLKCPNCGCKKRIV